MSETSVCLVGLPETGKTTFLAAFWGAAGDTSPRPGSYRIETLPDDRSYLQSIVQKWMVGEPVERNATGSVSPTEFGLCADGRADLLLRVPDLSGESFRDAAADRVIDEDLANLVGGSDLILFFIRVGTASTYMSLADLAPGSEDDEGTDQYEEFDPKKLSSDILNAELLQLLPEMRHDSAAPTPVAVIVSAWDEVPVSRQDDPQKWLSKEQPMFAQVLAEYARSAPVHVFGVSAQGADYERDSEVVTRPPAERPLVVDSTMRSSDIGLPFAWFDDLRKIAP